MSIFKKTAKAAVLIPIILIALFIAFEIFGAIVNSAPYSEERREKARQLAMESNASDRLK